MIGESKLLIRRSCENLEKEASVREGGQGFEGEEEHHNQTCLVVWNSGRGN